MTRKQRGDLAEQVAMAYELARIGSDAGRIVRFVGNRRHLGFDIQSSESASDLTPRFIEVKSLSSNHALFVTQRERDSLAVLGDRAWIYVVDVDEKRVVATIRNPLRALGSEGKPIVYKFNF